MLIKPTEDYIKEIESFKDEIFNSNTDYKFEGCAGLQNFDDIKMWLKKLEAYSSQETCPEGFVPSSLYLYVRDEDNKIIGMVDIRHHINHPILSKMGGHIGYSIRPSERGKGLGTKMLQEALEICKKLSIDKVLVTCNKGNTASEKVILKNGGVFENEVEHEGVIVKRYWIE